MATIENAPPDRAFVMQLVPETSLVEPSDRDLIAQAGGSLEVLQGKWKVHLLFVMARGIHRHSRLLDALPGASKKIMTETLRALERDGLVVRKVYAEVPVRVEYSLTPLGWTLAGPLVILAEWGKAHANDIETARQAYRRQH